MTTQQKVNWRVPTIEWRRFEDYVNDEYGGTSVHVAREVDMAMREWIDIDDFAGVEDRIDRLVRAAGRRPNDVSQKKRPGLSGPSYNDAEKTLVQVRVDQTLKNEFRRVVDKTDHQYGEALIRALRERRIGGRAARLEEKMDRIMNDAESLLSEINGESDLTLRDKKTIAICDNLSLNFEEDTLHKEIAAVAGDSEPTLRAYTERVLDRLDRVKHPRNPNLYITKDCYRQLRERGDDIPPLDAPAIDRKDYSDLSREEKVTSIQVELARETAARNCLRYQWSVGQIRSEVFDERATAGHTQDLTQQAGDGDGFWYTQSRTGNYVLQVDLEDVTDTEILDAVRAHLSTTDSGPDPVALANGGGSL